MAECDLDVFTSYEAEQLFTHLAAISHRTDVLLGVTARRLAAGQTHRAAGRIDVINRCAATLGALPSEVSRMIDTAELLRTLDEVAQAARQARLSGRELDMIAAVAVNNPDAQSRLLAAAGHGIHPLRDECLKVRRETETDGQQRTRMHRARSYRSWTDDEGMYHGHLRLTPELGAEVKTALEDMARVVFRNRDRNEPPERPENYTADALVALILRHATPPAHAPAATDDSTPAHDTARQADTLDDEWRRGSSEECSTSPSAHELHLTTTEGHSEGSEVDLTTCTEPLADSADGELTVGSQVERLRQLGRAPRRSRAVNVIVDFDALQRSELGLGGRCEIPGIGPVSVGWTRSILPASFLKLVITIGGDTRHVTHIGRRIPPDLLTALAGEHPPIGETGCGVSGTPKARGTPETSSFVVTVVFDARAWLCATTQATGPPGQELERSRAHNQFGDREQCDIPGVGAVDAWLVRSLLGESFLAMVTTRGRDIRQVVNEGRHIPAEVMTAIVAAGRECEVDGCYARGYLEVDHTVEHSRGGLSSWLNNRFRCAAHHDEKTNDYNKGRIHRRASEPP